jgi:hypothetical protein
LICVEIFQTAKIQKKGKGGLILLIIKNEYLYNLFALTVLLWLVSKAEIKKIVGKKI